ncbi:Protein SRG1 [Abeliophyllum distichum]|uniref:Protein SRG1 n=1 Tax=Abeliophyllum distichum TaxID=126358 RepID=A0ABD1PUR7_9LAMI
MESSSEVVNFGRSLIVPSVQELAKEPIVKIPIRYLRQDQDPPMVSNDMHAPSVPIINLQSLLTGESMIYELEKLHSACKDWGFFQIIDHGVSPSLLEEFRRQVIDFFNLPMEDKKKLWQQPDNHEGFGQLFVVSEEQKLDWSDMFYITTLPVNQRKIELFETLPTKLREMMEAYSEEMKKVAMTLLSQMAKALKMDDNEIAEIFGDGVQSMRMNYYPPCPEPESTIGFTPHSDAVALTILFQLNETEGLQIRKDGKWVPVKPLRNAFVVNVGDIMEIVSNGVYRSIEHRATVNSDSERLSVATFYSSNLNSELGPAHSLVGPNNPPVFRQMPIEKYFKKFFARKLNGKSYLDFMKFEVPENGSAEIDC